MSLIDNKKKQSFLIQWGMVLVAVVAIYQLPAWTKLDDLYNDYWRVEIAKKTQPSDDIIVIKIDDKSLSEMEEDIGFWPWPRTTHAFLVEGLLAANSKAIVFDIMFSERDKLRDGDEFFREVVSQQPNIFYAAALLKEESPEDLVSLEDLPQSFFSKPYVRADSTVNNSSKITMSLPWIIAVEDWNVGLIDFLADWDGSARRYPVVTEVQGAKLNSLPNRVAEYVISQPDTNTGNNQRTTRTEQDFIHLKYKGVDYVPFQSVSYAVAYDFLTNRKRLDLFKDKIVVIGATATGLHDLRETPIAQLYPATSILAMAIDNLILNDYLIVVNKNYGLMVSVILVSLLLAITFLFDSYRIQLALSIGLLLFSALCLLTLSYFLSQSDRLFPAASSFTILFSVLVVLLFYRGLKEYMSRQHALQTFSRFMDPVVVKQLMSDEDWQEKTANKSCKVSVLFSDIRGFTTLSEKRTAEEIMAILNNYFDRQVEAIFSTGGTLDKFIGDAVMAFWGAPIEDDNHAEHAVDAALKMVDNLLTFRESLPEELREFDVGIGVHSGDAVVGMLGSAKRFDYTAIGDTVNLGSRIEGVTKGIARILVSETTKELCGDVFDFEFKGEFAVKGREEKVKLYQPSRRVAVNEN
ncbi:adenylate/guanylate cyclase domain-containing protein [Aliikangiella coralliicola]|uniref:Adenylate/guanylate cyclase domain-containing protein n=1 Tax=Aliikangiella coralliicola TaxID=2592383 RepID=A0A545U6B2_9GAMM|nr:adenylate/guanylate cyclase domain-containing protein [Aliikangiella coralliicola]TQV85009.1 adenylate/guanylate cyclase domain-containing protein [Aliikangiella coralliicola]